MGWLNKAVAGIWHAGAWLASPHLGGDRLNEIDITALLAKQFGWKSKAGVTVSALTAMQVTTVLSCVRVIAEGVAQVPVKLFLVDDEHDTRKVAKRHPAHRVMYRRPNPWQTSFGFRETMTMHLVLTGNAFAFINRVGAGKLKRIREVIPIPPEFVKVRRLADYTLEYEISDPTTKTTYVIPRSDMLHITGPSWNNFVGLEPVKLAREAIGLAIATEENHARLHANGSQLGGILSTDKALDDPAIARLKRLWSARHEGLGNAFKTAVLDNGMKWSPLGMSGVDTEHVRTREMQVQEICRALRVFPQMVGFADKTATYASAEQFFIAHVIHSLGPWIERWEQSLDNQLLTLDEQDEGYTFKFNTAGLLRGDARARSELYKSGILTGWMTRNEARRLEDLNPIEGLDEPLVPLNMGIGGDAQAPTDDDPGTSSWPKVAIMPNNLVRALAQRASVPLDHRGPPNG